MSEFADIERALGDSVLLADKLRKIAAGNLDKIRGVRSDTDTDAADETGRIVSLDYPKFMSAYGALYDSYSEVFGLINGDSVFIKADTERILSEDRIAVRVSDGALYVKLPRMPVKAFNTSKAFVYELNLLLKNYPSPLPLIERKRIRIINVFTSDTPARLIPDNGNYDTKHLLDVITDYCGGGDSGLNCSLLMETIRTDDIPAGTYFIAENQGRDIQKINVEIAKLNTLFQP